MAFLLGIVTAGFLVSGCCCATSGGGSGGDDLGTLINIVGNMEKCTPLAEACSKECESYSNYGYSSEEDCSEKRCQPKMEACLRGTN